MLDIYTVSFFGHRHIDDVLRIEQALDALISCLLHEKEYVEFLVGRNGDFDLLVASAIKRCRRNIGATNSSLVWVTPYITAELRDNKEFFLEYYDEIEICDAAVNSHFKSAIQVRNRSMVDRSDLVVCCITHEPGGAFQALKYAQSMGVPLLNLLGCQAEG